MKTLPFLASFEAAAASLGIDPKVLPGIEGLSAGRAAKAIADYKLDIISESSWQGVEIDWSNYSQRKYYPWFNMPSKVGSGVGFSFYVYVCVGSGSAVGSRRVYPTREIAEYVGKKHKALYSDIMVITKR